MNAEPEFGPDLLRIDARREIDAIVKATRDALRGPLRKRGLVIGISGGIDSSVTAALCVEAVGRDRVIGLQMPERNSAGDTMALSTLIADHLGLIRVPLDITPILEAVGYYDKYDDTVRSILPEYGRDWKSKIVVSDATEGRSFAFFSVVAAAPDGRTVRRRLELQAYLEIVACTNFKQRIRKMLEYYHADRHNFAVAGSPNRLEFDQGFFVKLGDGAADLKPIAHLYKSQVYQLARTLGLPEAIILRPPTTDTYSLPQGQDEFFFSIPYEQMDLCLYGKNHGFSVEAVSRQAGLSVDQVQAVYQDISRKRVATRYLHLPPLLVADVPELGREGTAEAVRGAEK
jgi:NAD+ synthase